MDPFRTGLKSVSAGYGGGGSDDAILRLPMEPSRTKKVGRVIPRLKSCNKCRHHLHSNFSLSSSAHILLYPKPSQELSQIYKQ